MPISTVLGIWARRHKLFARLQENKIDSSRARIRESNFPELEKAMMIWLKQISSSASSVPINGPIIKCQAEKFACFLKIKDFKCSNGWLDGFRSRNKISYVKISGEAASVDTEVVSDWQNKVLPVLIEGYEHRDIFHADETALFYQAKPDKGMVIQGQPVPNFKKSKKRMTIMFATNWTGSDKLRPLVIGSSKNPRCLNHVNKNNLPCEY